MRKRRINPALLGAGVMSVLSIFVLAVSTFAWFTANHSPDQTVDIVSGSPGINIGKTTGYKKIGSEIKPHVVGQSEDTEDNEGSSQQDLTFDVPVQGSGYYLLKRYHDDTDGSDTFHYTHPGTTKLDELQGTHRATKSVTLVAGGVYRFMKYVTEDHETVNKRVAITLADDATRDICTYADGDVTIKAGKGGTYKIWLDHKNGTLGLEASVDFSDLHRKSLTLGNPRRSVEVQVPTAAANQKIIYLTNSRSWSTVKCYATDNSLGKWPGSNMSFVYKNTDNQDVYAISVSTSVTTVVFNNGNDGNSNQTQDCTLGSNNAFYIQYQWGDGDDNQKWMVHPWPTQITQKTYYFYNYYNKGTLYTTPYAYVFYKNTSSNDVAYYGGAYPGVAMSSVAGKTNIYSITVPSYLTTVVFSPGGTVSNANSKKTSDITLGNAGQYFRVSGGNDGSYTGSWYDSLEPSGTTNTIYLWDPNHLFGTTASNHYCYPWSSTGAAAEPAWPGQQMTASSAIDGLSDLYSFAISTSYDKLIFTNSSGSSQTGNLDKNTTKNFYVMHALDNVQNYSNIHITTDATRDFYVYDFDGLLGNSAPKAYAYVNNDPSVSNTYYTTYQNAAWPGGDTTKEATYEGTALDGLYKISVSQDFTHIIFNNGKNQDQEGAIQISDDLSGDWTATNNIFILKNQYTDVDNQRFYQGEWVDSLSIVTLYKNYHYDDGTTLTPLDGGDFAETQLGREITSKNVSYYPEYDTFPDEYIKDSNNGIYYRFEAEDDWLDSSGNVFTAQEGIVGASNNLYRRMVCDGEDLQTFYVDISDAYVHDKTDDLSVLWTGIHLHAWGDGFDSKGDGNYYDSFAINSVVAPGLFRVSLPSTVNGFQFTNGYQDVNNETEDISLTGKTSFLHINVSEGYTKHGTSWCNILDTNIGSAEIWVKSGSSAEARIATMSLGDLYESNLFVYELAGFELNVGDLVRIKIASVTSKGSGEFGLTAGTFYGFSHLDERDLEIGYDTESAGANNSIRITEKARYTFYLTRDKTVAIAQVPSYGNGFYIMSAASGVKGYGGGVKFAWANDEHTAGIYRGFNVKTENETYYIKSYLDAIDHLYVNFDTSRISSSDVSCNSTTGVITFKTATRYNITVTAGEGGAAKVTISLHQIEEFFTMNQPNPNQTVLEQDLAIVIEVQFTTTNSEPVRIGLDIVNPINSYVGVGFYASENPLASPWNDMHSGGRYSLSSALSLDSDLVVTAAKSGTTMYAYIIIDYLSATIPSTPAGTISFTLRANQTEITSSSSATSSAA